MSNLHQIIERPILTEKTTEQMDLHNKVTFQVARKATKPQIKAAVEKLFGVKVDKVNTHTIPGKPKRFGRQFSRTSAYKKAVVTLVEGEVLDFYALEGGLGDEEFGLEDFEDEV